MRVAIASVQVPFVQGGADAMTLGLQAALQRAGHQVDCLMMPFRFSPPRAVLDSMEAWRRQDFERFESGPIDVVLPLKFPAYYLSHHDRRVWLMHQHRSVYELFDTPYGESSHDPEAQHLRDQVLLHDREALGSATRLFTISPTVSERLQRFNGLASEALLQPPPHAQLFHSGPAMPYVFMPSRLEALKRQELLIRAMAAVSAPVHAVIAGEGGMGPQLRALVEQLGLSHRVRFIGRLSDTDLRRWYAHALAVFFGPYQEDYGFVTLEAMLSARPVITCTDSGGPTHFVRDHETGHVVAPEPSAVAQAIDALWGNRARARELGDNGRSHYQALNISWDHVIQRLLGP